MAICGLLCDRSSEKTRTPYLTRLGGTLMTRMNDLRHIWIPVIRGPGHRGSTLCGRPNRRLSVAKLSYSLRESLAHAPTTSWHTSPQPSKLFETKGRSRIQLARSHMSCYQPYSPSLPEAEEEEWWTAWNFCQMREWSLEVYREYYGRQASGVMYGHAASEWVAFTTYLITANNMQSDAHKLHNLCHLEIPSYAPPSYGIDGPALAKYDASYVWTEDDMRCGKLPAARLRHPVCSEPNRTRSLIDEDCC